MTTIAMKMKLILAGAVGLAVVAGCNQQSEVHEPPAPEVAVVTMAPQSVSLLTELPGRISSYRQSEIRPRVSGPILKRLFEEGADVKAGDSLYQIDPEPFQVAFDSAQAALETAKRAAQQSRAALHAAEADVDRYQANLSLAQVQSRRYDELRQRGASSAIEFDQAKTDLAVAEAALKVAQAQVASHAASVDAADAAVQEAEMKVKSTSLDLGYTHVVSPISGRIGRSNVTEGAMVTAYQSGSLATVQTLDPVYVDVPQSTVDLIRLRRNLASGDLTANGTDHVVIHLEDGTVYQHSGTLKFRDVSVDPTTGSVMLRIVVPNPDAILLPGMFVRAVIEEAVNPNAVLVPQQAVLRNMRSEPYVLLINAQGAIEQKDIQLGRAIGDKWLVAAGLTGGEQVVVEGLQRVRAGVTPRVVAYNDPTPTPAPASSAPASASPKPSAAASPEAGTTSADIAYAGASDSSDIAPVAQAN